jgi:hypothetical protein
MVRLWIGPVTVLPVATPSEPLCCTGNFCFLFYQFSKRGTGISCLFLVQYRWLSWQGSAVSRWAHIFLTDVLAAILFGIIWLALCVVLGKPIRRGGLRSQTAVIFADVDRPVLVPVERRAQRDSNLQVKFVDAGQANPLSIGASSCARPNLVSI